MFRKHFARAAALLAAAATTIIVFSAVAGLADEDRAELFAAQNPPAIVAGHGARSRAEFKESPPWPGTAGLLFARSATRRPRRVKMSRRTAAHLLPDWTPIVLPQASEPAACL